MSEIKLPAGWVEASLGDIIQPRGDRANPTDFPELLYLGMENVEPQTGRILGTVPASAISSSSARFFANDVLYGRMRPYLNKVALPDFSGLASAEFIVFPANEFINSRFIKYRLSNPDFVKFACSVNEGDRPRVKFEQVAKFKLLVPPIAEQIRIVEKLEELFSDLDAGVAELKAAQKKLAQYRQALLKAAVEGALTAEWRTRRAAQDSPVETGAQLLTRILAERRRRWEEKQLAKFAAQGKTPPKDWQTKYPEPVQPDTSDLPELPEGWTWARVGNAGDVQLGRQRAPQYHTGANMVPYLRVANVFEDRIDISDVMEMHFSPEEEENFKLRYDDILLNEGQSLELVGRSAIFRDELPRACFTNTLVRFRAEDGVQPEYAQTLFLHYLHSGRFRKVATITTNIAHLGAGRLAEIEFPLPGAEEQQAIVAILKEELERIQQLQAATKISLRQSEAQRKNILKAAFSGQLVAQDPNDEPASVLLERIRAARAARAQQPKPRKAKARPQEVQILMKKLVDVLAEAGDWITAEEAFGRCGVADGTSTERIEELYAELRELVKAEPTRVEVEREDNSDKLKLTAHGV